MKKTWIMLKRGILDPKHREKIGIRIWLYLHMLDRANWVQGAVLEWKDEAEADAMEMDLATLRAQRRQLEVDGYIECERRGHDQRVKIIKWVNPREYSGKVYNPPGVAVPGKGTSGESLTLGGESLTADRRSGDSQSDSQSVTRVSNFLHPLKRNLTYSHITNQEEQNKSALASFFESKPEPEPPAERTPTNWPQAAERLRPFLDAYEEWTGFHPPKGSVRSLWLSGAKEWVDTFGESSLRLFEDAMCYCDKNGLRPKSPKGLLFYGEDKKRKPADPDSDEARRRYVEGEFADMIEH